MSRLRFTNCIGSTFGTIACSALLLATNPVAAQVPCGALVSPGLLIQENQVAIGQELSVTMSFGISPSAVQINQFTVRLDCTANTGCIGDNSGDCVDAGDVIRFEAFESLTGPGTAGTTVTVDESIANHVRFIFTPPLDLPALTLVTLQYRISVHGLGPPPFPKIISHTGQYSGVCAPGTAQQTSSNACGQLNFTIVAPAIHIEKEACPSIVCEGENNTVVYTYRVSTGTGNAPISNVCIVDDNGTPGNPADDFNSVQRTPPSQNNPNPPSCGANPLIVFQSGDTNNDGILDPGETWVYTASISNITGARRNIATVTGAFVNGLGSEPVTDNDDAQVFAIRTLRFPQVCAEELCARLVDSTGTAVNCTPVWTFNGQTIPSVPCGNNPTGCSCITLDSNSPAGNYLVTFTCAGTSDCPGGGPVTGSCELPFTPPPAPCCEITATSCPYPRTLTVTARFPDGPGAGCDGPVCTDCTFAWGTATTLGGACTLSGATGNTLVINDDGIYCVVVTAANGCDSTCYFQSDCEVAPLLCRVTGGGNSRDTANPQNKYNFGGQAGAPTAAQPNPRGEWTHSSKPTSPAGVWTFHGGTASAPPGTRIHLIECCDPDWCVQARPAPAKQIDFEGVGTFKNINSSNFPSGWAATGGNRTYHWFEVHIEDLGEPGNSGNQNPQPGANCPPEGSNCAPADCGCPDFYRIVIYKGFRPSVTPTNQNPHIPENEINKTDVMYTVYGYIDNGNLQIHPPIGDINNSRRVDQADVQLLMSMFGNTPPSGVGDFNLDGKINNKDLAIMLAVWGPVLPAQ